MKIFKMLPLAAAMLWFAPATGVADNSITFSETPLSVSTDKCMYSPGDAVAFTVSGTLPEGAHVRYRKGINAVHDEPLTANQWTWTAPESDFTGYIADIYVPGENGTETIYATIGVDVSSSWAKYPRYGFVATYDEYKTKSRISNETAWLNRCHINGVQFYDWHYRHHKPLSGKRGNPSKTYKDIANRTIVSQVVKNYISAQHAYGMKAMFYNLLYGAQPNANVDGVDIEWGVYKDATHTTQDFHALPDSWAGPIYLYDPSNADWQNYLADRNDDVYATFDFDGYHIDQLGYRGDSYTYDGKKINLPQGYASFINAMKQRHPDKNLVMNAVSNYGSDEILSTGNVDFAYSELWAGEQDFSSIESITRGHAEGNNPVSTVLAAYMNYNVSDGQFNTPGILLTDATMFAVGASHLELGDHMLCSEYFPNAKLSMSDELQSRLTTYYDFLVGYEQYLRGNGNVADVEISCTNKKATINAWPAKKGNVAAYARQLGAAKVVQLLNYTKADNMSWRDYDGTMPAPEVLSSVAVRLKVSDATRVWTASPDTLGGLPQELPFQTDGEYITFTVPSLEYWTMVVVEQGMRRPMIVGEAVWGGWSTENSCVMTPVEGKEGVYTYTGYFKADCEFKFLTRNNWGEEYRNANHDDPYVNTDARIRFGGGNDDKFKVAESGNYNVTVDLNNMTLHMEKAAYQDNQILHSVIYLIGDATPAGWNLLDAVPMKQDAANPFLFTTTVKLTSTGDFKIAVNNHGGWGQRFYHPESGDKTKITDDGTDDRKWTVSANGYYAITVDLLAKTISIEETTGINSAKSAAGGTSLAYDAQAANLACTLPSGKAGTLAVYTTDGQTVLQTSVGACVSANAATVSVSTLPTGVYTATLSANGTPDSKVSLKFIVK